jgi:hypothetical protein
MEEFRASSPGVLPQDAEALVGGVALPDGHRRHADPTYAQSTPVDDATALWITDDPVVDTARVWLALAEAFPQTGLWPVVARELDDFSDTVDPPGRPWDSGEFEPANVDLVSGKSAADVLAENWRWNAPDYDDPAERELFAPLRIDAFPGLAAATTSCESDALEAVTLSMGGGRIALVAVTRPADVLARIGWLGPANYVATTMTDYVIGMSAVLRSWEDRFGAYLVALGFDTVTLAVTKPPQSNEETLGVTAEHFAFAPDNIYQGVGNFADYADALADATKWTFWWD